MASSSASSSSSLKRSCTASLGDAKRPEAFILGAIPNATFVDEISDGFMPETSMSFLKPALSVFGRYLSPLSTINLFSPVRQTISAIVAIATSSPYCSIVAE